MKRDWKIKSASGDISFCWSMCGSLNCSRNINGKLFRSVVSQNNLYSCCDFSKECCSYKRKPLQTVIDFDEVML